MAELVDEATPLFTNSNGNTGQETSSSSTSKGKRSRKKKRLDRWESSEESSASSSNNTTSPPFFPGDWDTWTVEVTTSAQGKHYQRATVSTMRLREYRSLPRRLFLFLTEPTSSVSSSMFFAVVILAIVVMNGLMILQTMDVFQYTPEDCLFCGGTTAYLFDDDANILPATYDDDDNNDNIPPADCVCAPTPYPWTDTTLQYLVYFFSVEWILRVLCYAPAPQDRASTIGGRLAQFTNYVLSWPMVLDFWATFPYYMEFTNFDTNGLMSLRLLRLFRVFQLVRLGSYNVTFTSLMVVLQSSLLHLKILFLILAFGAALFGSLLFWLEKGTWQYHEGEYQFVRESASGELEPSPFTSIPATFYWFLVTATTVGYGDIVPTTTGGRYVAIMAMILSLLVVAFPVSVFSDLWSKELERVGALKSLDTLLSESDNNDDDDDDDLDRDDNAKPGDKEATIQPKQSAPPEEPLEDVVPGANIIPPATSKTSDNPSQEQEDAAQGIPATLNPFSAHRVNPITGSATRSWNYGYQHAPHVVAQASDPTYAGNSTDDSIVVLHKSDLAAILRHTQQISQSQAQIRTILKKYKLLKPSNNDKSSDLGQP